MKILLQSLTATLLLMISATAMAETAQQFFFACYTSDRAVISVQEDAAGSFFLTRTENEKVSALDMTASNQHQILVTVPGDGNVVSLNNGDTKQITMNFHGKPESQVVLTITGTRMSIAGTGAALGRVKDVIYGSKSGRGLSGCSIDIQ